MNRLITWLRADVVRLRNSGIGCLLLLFFGMAMLMTTCGVANNAVSKRITTPEIATITGFGVYEGRWQAGSVIVGAQDARGRVGRAMVDPSAIKGCRVGDKIRAGYYGLALYPHPAPCPIKLDPGEAKALAKT